MNKLLSFFGCALMFMGCGESKPAPTVVKVDGSTKKEVYDMSVVMTEGNFSFIPMHLEESAWYNSWAVLRVMNAFEKTHPELEIVGWGVEKQQSTYGSRAYLYGVWVHHRKRDLTPESPK